MDREDSRGLGVSRALLAAIAGQTHVGVISNVVREELAQAPDGVKQTIEIVSPEEV